MTKVHEVCEVLRSIPLDEGEYEGTWTGYLALVSANGRLYQFHTVDGIRGMKIPCIVRVKDGKAMVQTKSESRNPNPQRDAKGE